MADHRRRHQPIPKRIKYTFSKFIFSTEPFETRNCAHRTLFAKIEQQNANLVLNVNRALSEVQSKHVERN